ncbi:Androgen-dependent TFPI-regulating protein-like isoform X1 [Oopsacas minuta]|uniref:Androgen-dependent TFPI-regulating protein-like isoform X1 n=1 Tax=Oopsacas minuta TaxID=111878 RepID=A0AAV7K583_9METZ|nr:Androgen-dependent TFPI-regulating protein-like isoform X1 [Oopsacas minuta]
MTTKLVPDGLDDQEELWDSSSSSEDEGPVPSGTITNTLTKRASPFTQSTFHCFSLAVYVGIKTYEATIFKGIPADVINTSFTGWQTFGARWKYLTYINLWIQFLYFFLAFFTDVVPASPLTPKLRRLTHLIYSCFAFPLGIFVMVTFWGVYWVDPELIWPKVIADHLPPLLNHLWHTAVGVLILSECVLMPHEYMPLMPTAYMVCFGASLYVLWVLLVFTMTDKWVYPLLAVMPKPLIPVFFIFLTLLLLLFTFMGYVLNRILWTVNVPVRRKEE